MSRLLCLLVLLSALLPTASGLAAPLAHDQVTADRQDRFFGAVQAIYNPQRADEAGVQWERLIFPWSLIQKDGPDSWQKGYFSDGQIEDELATGREVVGVALYTPQWATSTPNAARTPNVPANLYLPYDDRRNYWGQFMYRLASHYRGQIDTWILWNEPDMYTDQVLYTWEGSVEDMYQLIKVGYLAVKAANPDARVVLPGLTYWWDKEAGRRMYLDRLLDVAAKDPSAPSHNWYFDVANLHVYGNPLNVFAAATVFRRALDARGLKQPIWIDEANVIPYDDPRNPLPRQPFRASMEDQASYMIEAFALARAAGVERMSVYKLADEAPEGQGDLYGLVRNDGSARPAFGAFQTAVEYLAAPRGAVYAWQGIADAPSYDQITQLVNSNAQISQWVWPAPVNRVTLEQGTRRVTVVWNAGPTPQSATLPAVATHAAVVNKYGAVTGEVVAQNGQYRLDLPPSTDNTDPRYPDLYLVGGDPFLLVEQVEPLPDTVAAPLQVVWPHDGAPITQATGANLTALVLDAKTDNPIPCRWSPTVRLMASVDGGTARAVATGARRMVSENGVTYPVWDFNNVDVMAATRGAEIDFWIDVDGAADTGPRWRYAATVPQPPFWQQKPTTSCR